MTSTSTRAAPASWRERIAGGGAVRLESPIVLTVLCAAMATLSNVFLSVSNILNILLSTSVFGVLAIGMTFVISSAGIDLSVGSILALSGVVGAMLDLQPRPALVDRRRRLPRDGRVHRLGQRLPHHQGDDPARSSSRSACSASRAVSRWCSATAFRSMACRPEMVWLGQGRPFGVPTPVIILLLTALAAHVLLAHTRFGVYAQVIGDNEARRARWACASSATRRMLYTLSGLLSGLAGLLFAARINSGEPTAGLSYELTAITATILGGTNLFGGRGSVVGTLIGALIMGVLQNGLNLIAVRPFYQQIAIGAVLILAVWLDRINSSAGWRR